MFTPPPHIRKISIIMAVYKAEPYLKRCLDSIINQTFKDFELLLIDDGSPDNSGKICDEYGMLDNRIKVFHRRHTGISATRQFGVDNAIGIYTIHVDPDDWVEADYLEVLYKEAVQTNADIVICDFYEELKNESRYVPQPIIHSTSKEILKDFLLDRLRGYLWNKLIRRSLYENCHARFPSFNCKEDVFICCSFFIHDVNVHISYVNRAFYHYDCFSNAHSIVRTQKMMCLQSSILFVNYFESILDQNEFRDTIIHLKCNGKRFVFATGILGYEDFCNLYSEINDYYIVHSRRLTHRIFNIAVLRYGCIGKILWNTLCFIRLLQKKR